MFIKRYLYYDNIVDIGTNTILTIYKEFILSLIFVFLILIDF